MSALPVSRRSSLPQRQPFWLLWLLFILQLLVVEIFDAANDVIRGDVFPPSPQAAIDNARQVIHFESVHGFFVEPDLYTFALHRHHTLGIALSSSVLLGIANNVYAFFHLGLPILVAAWVYLRHRRRFGLLRNVYIMTCVVALVGYFVYPVAPPRLTTGIVWHGHPFQFHNTMPYPRSALLINGRPLGYNPYAAMPSLHIAWATTTSVALFLLSRKLFLRLFAVCYPAIMTLAIVMTANHYIMDGVGGLLTFAVAAPLALAIAWIMDSGSLRTAGWSRDP